MRTSVTAFMFLLAFGWAQTSNAAAATSASTLHLQVAGARIDVELPPPGRIALTPDELKTWVTRSACAVSAYYGRFPVRHFRLRLDAQEGARGVPGGTTYSDDGAFSIIRVGSLATARDLERDWVLTHEMVHLATPRLREEHHWLEEGIATYVEPIARVYVGNEDVADVWSQLVDGLPKGMPEPGDRGLDHSQSWGSTYWGGALFCTLAEVRIRRLTHNALGLRDALRAVTSAGGSIETGWPITKLFTVMDAKLPKPVLGPLYAEMKDAPMRPDLAALFTDLGVEARGGKTVLRDDAKEAALRRAVTTPPPGLHCATGTSAE